VYALSETTCLKYLLQLDRLRLIALLPGNRIRLAVARDFDWHPDGPIRRYFREQCQGDFLNSPFQGATESMAFVNGMLSGPALLELQRELARLRRKFSELHEESVKLPLNPNSEVGAKMGFK
jgi:hypothetical protein